MSPLAIRGRIRRHGRRSAGLVALVMILGAVQVHHADLSMGDMPHDGGVTPIVMTICAGMLTAIGAAVAAVAIGLLVLGPWPARRPTFLRDVVCDPCPIWARARAGPPPLLLICVSRR